MKTEPEKIRWQRFALIIGGIVLLFFLSSFFGDSEKNEEKSAEKITTKPAEVVPFGIWSPNAFREITATVQSPSDVKVQSEVTGTISDVFVNIGDEVKTGQILARFRQTNDTTQISYENSVSSLGTAKISAENSVTQAQIGVQNAETQLQQTRISEKQAYQQNVDNLAVEIRSAKTSFENAIDWADELLGATRQFQYQVDADGVQVGRNDSINKQTVKNNVAELVPLYEKFNLLSGPFGVDKTTVIFTEAESLVDFLAEARSVIRAMDRLIRNTNVTTSFPDTTRNALTSEAQTFAASLDNAIISLESDIESTKSKSESTNLSIISAENSLKNAKAQLELAKAQGENQIASAQNQFRLAQKSRLDLDVKAPFSGKVTEKFINPFDQVSSGTQVFSIVSKQVSPEIIAYVTQREFEQFSASDGMVKILLANGTLIKTSTSAASYRLDPVTQKMEIRFLPNSDEIDQSDITVGSFAKIYLPIESKGSNLLPISAISFEPEGAEVLINSAENITERRPVLIGEIVSDAVEIIGGLQIGDRVIRYRNRVVSGDSIEPIDPTTELRETVESETTEDDIEETPPLGSNNRTE